MKNKFNLEVTGISEYIQKDGPYISIITDVKQSHYNKLRSGKLKEGEDTVVLYYAQSISNLVVGYLEGNYTIVTTSDEVFVIGAASEYLMSHNNGALIVLSTSKSDSIYKNVMYDMPRTQWVILDDIETMSASEFKELSKERTSKRKDLTTRIKELKDEQGESDANADEIELLMKERKALGELLSDKYLTSSTLARLSCRVAKQLCVMNTSDTISKVNKNACIDAVNHDYPTISYNLRKSAEAGEYKYTVIKFDASLMSSLQKACDTILDENVMTEVLLPTEQIVDLVTNGELNEAFDDDFEIYKTVESIDTSKVNLSLLSIGSKPTSNKAANKVFQPSKTVLSSTVFPITADNENIFGAPVRLTIGISSEDAEDVDTDEDIEITLPMYTQSSLIDLLSRKINGFFNNKAIVATYLNNAVGSTVEATQILMEVISARREEGKPSKGIVFYSNGNEENDEVLERLKEYPEIMVINPTVMSKFLVGKTKDALGNTLPNVFSTTNIDYMVMAELCDSVNINTSTSKVLNDLINMFILLDKPTGVSKKNKNNIYEPVKSQLTKPKVEAKISAEPKTYMTTMNMYPVAKEKLTREICLKAVDPQFVSIDNGEVPTKADLNPEGVVKQEKKTTKKKETKPKETKAKSKSKVKSFGEDK